MGYRFLSWLSFLLPFLRNACPVRLPAGENAILHAAIAALASRAQVRGKKCGGASARRECQPSRMDMSWRGAAPCFHAASHCFTALLYFATRVPSFTAFLLRRHAR